MDGGELSPESAEVDHLLDNTTQLFSRHRSWTKDLTDRIFTLIALYRATSAKLQDFDQDINIELEASKSFVAKEEQALERMLSTY